jgi:hypothetical protein
VDAQKLVANTRNWRRDPAVQGVIVLLGYLAALLSVILLGNLFIGQWGLLPTAFLSYFAFELLVNASCRYRVATAKPEAVVAPSFSD